MTDHPPFPSCPLPTSLLASFSSSWLHDDGDVWREAHTVARQPEQVSPPHRSRSLAVARIVAGSVIRNDYDDDDSDHRF